MRDQGFGCDDQLGRQHEGASGNFPARLNNPGQNSSGNLPRHSGFALPFSPPMITSPFWSLFIPCLAAMAVGHSIKWFFLAPKRRHLGASVLESLAFAFALSAHAAVFERWPNLRHGWSGFFVVVLSIALIWLPGLFASERLRDRRANHPDGAH